jgi:valyl-tRNA synthetase
VDGFKRLCFASSSVYAVYNLYLALQDLKGESSDETIMRSKWCSGKDECIDTAAEKAIEQIKEAVRGIRAVRTEKQVPPSQKIVVEIIPANDEALKIFVQMQNSVALLTGAKEVNINALNTPAFTGAVSVIVPDATVYLPLDSLVDSEKERARLQKEKKKLTEEISRIDAKLSNEGFISKAPANLIAAEREKREKFAAMLAKVEDGIGSVL